MMTAYRELVVAMIVASAAITTTTAYKMRADNCASRNI
jgi:hypothetical protein